MYRRTKGGLNSELHVICDAVGRLIRVLLTAGSVSDYAGAACLLPAIPPAPAVPADRGYDAAWGRTALRNQGSTLCTPFRNSSRTLEYHDRKLYRKRHRSVENMFAMLKDWPS